MEFLRSLLEAKKKPLKQAAKSVYHRDYEKTKNRPYRKYDHQKRAHEDEELSLNEKLDTFEPKTGTVNQDRTTRQPSEKNNLVAKKLKDKDVQSKKKNLKEEGGRIRFDRYGNTKEWTAKNEADRIAANKQKMRTIFKGSYENEEGGSEELGQQIIELTGLLAKYDDLKSGQEEPSDEQNSSQSFRQELDSEQDQQQSQQHQPTEKPLQFSSFLYQTMIPMITETPSLALVGDTVRSGKGFYLVRNGKKIAGPFPTEKLALWKYEDNGRPSGVKVIKEEKWDFDELPPQESPNAPAGVSDVDANERPEPQGMDLDSESNEDLDSVKKSASQCIKRILNTIKQLGPDAKQELEQLCAKHCGDQVDRVLAVLTKAGQKLGVEI